MASALSGKGFRLAPTLVLPILLAVSYYAGIGLQAGSGATGSYLIVLEYELGSGLIPVPDAAGLLGLDEAMLDAPQGGYRVCLALADPEANVSGLDAAPKARVECWGAQCPYLMPGGEPRSAFTRVRSAFVCAAEARLRVELGGGRAVFKLALSDYVFVSFRRPWFTGSYTLVNISLPGGLGSASVYVGSGGGPLTLEAALSDDAVRRRPLDLSILAANATEEGWLVLYHHSPLSAITLDGTAHPMAIVVYNARAGSSGYLGKAVYWWAKVIRVEDPTYYNDVAEMARILAERWNATLETAGNDTIIVRAAAAELLGLPRSPYWKPTYYNITRLEEFYELIDSYGAVRAGGRVYIVDPRLISVDPLRLRYTVNGSLAILEGIDVDVQEYGPPMVGAAAAATIIEPPLVPDILLHTLNVTGIAVKGHRLLSLVDASVQTQAPAGPGEPPQEPPESTAITAAAAALAILLALALLVKYKVAGRGGPRAGPP